MDDYAKIDHIPVLMANHNVGFMGIYSEPHGGIFAKVCHSLAQMALEYHNG